VLSQRYSNWVAIVGDNASTDDTARIVQSFEARDVRIRSRRYATHVGVLENWNRALAEVPDEACYVKQLNVDDRLRPDCLLHLVAAAEADPQVAVVSSYFTVGRRLRPRERVSELRLVSGRDIVRSALKRERSPLVHPSVLLLRKSAVRSWPALYEARRFPPDHPSAYLMSMADKEAFFDTLAHFDLAFVPVVLTDLAPTLAQSTTGALSRVGAWHAGRIETILRHADRFLSADERRTALRTMTWRYFRSLAWRLLRARLRRDPEFRRYHHFALAHLLPQLAPERIGPSLKALRLLSVFFLEPANPRSAEA
jgi:hypothetical protein